jgi:hypothetical protein
MKLKLFIAAMLSIFLVFTACSSDDSVSVIDIEEPEPDPGEEPEIDPLLVDTWKMDPTAGSFSVGPSREDFSSFFSISASGVTERDCFFDDRYIFNEDGTFENELGDETWLESWQDGVENEGCGAPVPPHDGSNTGTWSAEGETITLNGNGVFLGLAKVNNDNEEVNPAGNTIEYEYSLSEDNTILEVFISGFAGETTWYYRLTNDLDKGNNDDNDGDEEKTIINDVNIDFEGEAPEFRIFGGTDDQGAGVEFSVIENPDQSDANPSETVGSFLDPDQSVFYTGTATTLEGYISFDEKNTFDIKVWSPIEDAVIRFKLEDSADPNIFYEADQTISEANTWEELTYEIPAADSEKFDTVVIFFNFDPNGDQSPKEGENIYFFDDIVLR